jgi:threonine/homoserine/homoserine lactone efflux protein
MLALFLRGISLGFTAGVMPGPYQSYIINTTLLLGWRRSIITIFSPLLADIPIIFLVVFLLGQLPPEVIRVIKIAGGLLLLWIAWGAWQNIRQGRSIGAGDEAPATTENETRKIFTRSLLMNLLNPNPYIFWGTVTGPLLLEALQVSGWHAAGLLLGFYGGFVGMLAVIVAVFNRVRHLDPRITRAVLVATLVILVVFGLSLIFDIPL